MKTYARIAWLKSLSSPSLRTFWTILCLTVWLLVDGVAPMFLLVQSGDSAAHWSYWTEKLVQAGVWVLGWTLLHRLVQGANDVPTHLHATALALAVDATVLQWGLPGLWFALAWPWHPAWMVGAQYLLLGWLVRHHLMQVLPGGWGPGIQRLGTGVLVVLVMSATAWHEVQRWADPDGLPYVQNVFPAALVVKTGVDTEAAVQALWPDER
jgi:hypothetical protein